MFKKIKKYCPVFALVCAALAVAAAVCHILICAYQPFADGFGSSAGYAVRVVLSKISGIFPFSIAEILIFAIPLALIVSLVIFIVSKNKAVERTARYISCLFAALSLFYTFFVAALIPGYHGTPLSDLLGLEDKSCSAESLYLTATLIEERMRPLLDSVTFTETGSSDMGYDFSELGKKLNDSFAKASGKYTFIKNFSSRPKPILLSEPMTYTHMSGIYSYYTGEANVNVNFPDYTVAYTAAHEMSHQRGISKEDEANFTAFLVCAESEDPYISYSGYISLYEYVMTALYRADRELYFDVIENTDKRVIGEIRSYNDFFEKYRENKAAEISSAVNDNYLRSQGVAAGERSYGLVVDLAVAYFSEN